MIGTLAALAQLAADVAAVDVRQTEVEEDEVVSGRRQGVGPGGDVDDLMAVGLQAGDERLGDRPVVLDEEQLHAHIVEDCREVRRHCWPNRRRCWTFLGRRLAAAGTSAPYRRRGRRQDE